MEFYSAIKKNERMAFASKGVELGKIMLREINQTEKIKG